MTRVALARWSLLVGTLLLLTQRFLPLPRSEELADLLSVVLFVPGVLSVGLAVWLCLPGVKEQLEPPAYPPNSSVEPAVEQLGVETTELTPAATPTGRGDKPAARDKSPLAGNMR